MAKIKQQKNPELSLAIMAVGFSPPVFATEKLGISYQLFRYRVRQGRLTLEDYWKILHYTGRSFEDLFPNPTQYTPKPISLTLRTSPKARLTPAPVERMVPEPKPPAPAPLPVQYEQPALVTDFEPIDVYGGLPPVEWNQPN